MYAFLGGCLLSVGLAATPATTKIAKTCPTTFNPGSFTKGNFFTNFDNSCYLIPFSTGNGSGGEAGDLNSLYNKIYFKGTSTIPPYQFIIVGQFPNARYFSVGLYDNHSAIIQNLTDANIAPLTSSEINPFEPGVAFVGGQQYAIPINLGGTPGTLEPGCVMTGYDVNQNAMDGTQRHAFINWNLDSAFFTDNPGTPDHEVDTPTHSNPNPAGAIIVRTYLSLTPPTAAILPHIIVRDVASGCAYPASMINTMGDIVTTDSTIGNTWQNQTQVNEHNTYANWQATGCWGDPPTGQSEIAWIRGDEYVSGANPDTAYLYAYVPSGLPQTLATAGEVMRFQFRVPTTPPTPCTDGCSRTGNEQMRYMSLSFQIPAGNTLASIADSCPINPINPCIPFVQDANGYVTLIVGTGVPQPPQVTAANGYTWLDLSQFPNYLTLNEIAIRDILPAASFSCGGNLVPYKTGENTTLNYSSPYKGEMNGLMGIYAPDIEYPLASSLPATASEVIGPTSCGAFPIGPPAASPTCEVLLPNTPAIAAVTTQCEAEGCDGVVEQPQPPISIVSASGGFGFFPFGLPYIGTSAFLQITDTTQGWSAGYTGDLCTVQIGEWSDSSISVIANVNENGLCPMVAGDQLTVQVWDPQHASVFTASSTVTVAAPSGSDPRRP
ncbi:MAG: hypothetical protein ABSH50_22270 [Bryobacteraceae bacterium]